MDKRFMRLIWNIDNWEKPSGHPWKKENKNKKTSYENKFGFGHEEWLFNPRYLIDGYQYGYVRGVEKAKLKKEKIDELHLFTISPQKEFYYVGVLKNTLRVLENSNDQTNLDKLKEQFNEEELEELKLVNADYNEFKKVGKTYNIKFRLEDAMILDTPIPISVDILKFHRYQPYILKDEINDIIKNVINESRYKLIFNEGKAKEKRTYNAQRSRVSTLINSLHTKILRKLYDVLSKENKNKLSAELSRVNNKIIDLLEKTGQNKYIFYEIKTHNSGLLNIREALGQIMEYALFDDRIVPKKLVIVGPGKLNEKAKNYLNRLKTIIELNLEYWSYDSETDKFIKY